MLILGRGISPYRLLSKAPMAWCRSSLFLDHLLITQLGTGNQLLFPGSPPFACSRKGPQDAMMIFKRLPIGIHPITHPDRPVSFPKTSFGFRNPRLRQRRLLEADHKRKHQPIFLGKGNHDPNFALQRIALWRKEFFLTKVHSASSPTWETFNCLSSKASIFPLGSAASFNQCRTVSNLTPSSSAAPRKGIPLIRSFRAIKTFSSEERRS